MRTRAGLHGDKAAGLARKERQHPLAPELLAEHDSAGHPGAVRLEHALGQIKADGVNLFHGRLPQGLLEHDLPGMSMPSGASTPSLEDDDVPRRLAAAAWTDEAPPSKAAPMLRKALAVNGMPAAHFLHARIAHHLLVPASARPGRRHSNQEKTTASSCPGPALEQEMAAYAQAESSPDGWVATVARDSKARLQRLLDEARQVRQAIGR